MWQHNNCNKPELFIRNYESFSGRKYPLNQSFFLSFSMAQIRARSCGATHVHLRLLYFTSSPVSTLPPYPLQIVKFWYKQHKKHHKISLSSVSSQNFGCIYVNTEKPTSSYPSPSPFYCFDSWLITTERCCHSTRSRCSILLYYILQFRK